ncbi:TPA: hypothetical protein PC598_001451 [Morganella morganii]|nr:hypothetical protein [Morganella morganii]
MSTAQGFTEYSNDQSPDSDISFLIDDEACYIPENTTTRSGADARGSVNRVPKTVRRFSVMLSVPGGITGTVREQRRRFRRRHYFNG